MKCGTTDPVRYNIKVKDVALTYECTGVSHVTIIGKGAEYGTSIKISSEGWKSLKTLEIRHVGKVTIEGNAETNNRNSIIISSCGELTSSSATHWGVTTIIESVKKVSVVNVQGDKEKNSIVSIS